MPSELRLRIESGLANGRVRANIRRAMDHLVHKRAAAFPDTEERERLREQGEAIRAEALARLPELLETLERTCTGNGMRVHWAETAAEANRIVLDILRAKGARTLIKGKSMVSEEMGLNAFLGPQGIEAVETDLGELILQLGDERPSHIIAPAIHKDRYEVAELFGRCFPELPYREDIEGLTAAARGVMRERFRAASAGLSGVNFAVAETGTLCLVENEGNGRLCTSAPDVHIAVMGIEKVIARLEQLPPLLTLLTRSATGQPVTTYVNLISGPRRAGERDGPSEVHLILLDNGRSRVYADPELRGTLACIRCGACMNHCPIYARLGGHAYGTVYPGPIGSILEPQLQGLDRQGELAEASTLCGACAEACPVKIPIPKLLNRLRWEAVRPDQDAPTLAPGSRRRALPALIWRLWAWVYASPGRYRAIATLAGRLRWLVPRRLGAWTRSRTAPVPAPRPLSRLVEAEGFERD